MKASPQFEPETQNPAQNSFYDFVLDKNFPCIMAQTVFRTDKVKMINYEGFGTKQAVPSLLKDLSGYLDNYNFDTNDFFTFVALFPDSEHFTEEEFEDKLWKQLQYLHEADGTPWDPSVSHDPENKNFSFSISGKAFYIVGLHPGSSRLARQSPVPALVFNLHFQFEKLKEMGTYQTIRDKIRERDIVLQGNINPMVKDFGKESEARQYSGREVSRKWKCPFHHK